MSTGPGEATGREREGRGNREKASAERRRERPRCLDYRGKSHWERGSPAPGLKGLGQRAGYARSGLRDARRTRRPGPLW